MSTVDINTADLDQLRSAAEKLGLDIDGRWGVDKVRQVVAEEIELRNADKAASASRDNLEKSSMPDLGAAVEAEREQAAREAAAQVEARDKESPSERKARLRKEATALVRIRISCMDPSKKDLKGELFCISNRNFGTIQRFVPYNREWHVERVLLDMIKEKEYMVFDSEKTGRAGIEVKTPRNVPTYNIQILPPLTERELAELAVRQAAAQGSVN